MCHSGDLLTDVYFLLHPEYCSSVGSYQKPVISAKMATAYENLVKHLRLSIRQLIQIKADESVVDHVELYDLMDAIQSLLLSLELKGSPLS